MGDLTETLIPPRRTRWRPKREQVEMLESIFSSGTPNPTTLQITKIRKSVERLGFVTNTNIFLWFQNRRQRRRLEEKKLKESGSVQPPTEGGPSTFPAVASSSSTTYALDGSCTYNNAAYHNTYNDLLSCLDPPADPGQMSDQTPATGPGESIMVFINGDASAVVRNRVYLPKNLMMYDSSGTLLPVNESGYLVYGLNPGQSYHLEWTQK